MKIKEVQVDGFGVWSGLSVHSMPDGMTVFYGPNEAGKTTLMQFLRTMFYGFTPERRTRYLPPVYGGKPGGAIRVTGPGGGYEICRRAQLDQYGSTGALSVTGSDGQSQGPHRLTMLLGQVDESIFTNVFAIGLRELQELSTLDDTAAADELYKLSSGLDRVSLVDVIRQLRTARQQIASPESDEGQLQRLMTQREKLKDEIEHLSGHGRRWAELASLKSSHAAELEELKLRMEQWALEAKGYEIAQQVRPTWIKKSDVQQRMALMNARLELPDYAADKLAELDAQIKLHQEALDGIVRRRTDLREQVQRLPLRPGIMEMAAKIEAAAEQGPWIASLQKAQQRLESQLDQARQELVEDAARLGMSEQDQQALLEDGKLTSIPDLSRQALNQLAEPASEVRMWSSRVKQASDQCEVDQRETEKLEQDLTAALKAHNQSDIQSALSSGGEISSLLRKRITLEEQLKKQQTRRKQLDEEAVDLQVDEAFSVERALLLGVIFVAGAFMVLWGLGYWITLFGNAASADPNKGLMFFVVGVCALFVVYIMNMTMEKGNTTQLDEVEEQIAALGKEIHKTQIEREELDRRLPIHQGDPEQRLREMESNIQALESLLPLQQNLQAAKQRWQAAKKRLAQANESLTTAKANWRRTLQHFGLSQSMSPKNIRLMADGYDSLLQTRRRLSTLTEELESRQIELGAITQRIDALSRQVFAAKAASDAIAEAKDLGQASESTSFGRSDDPMERERAPRTTQRPTSDSKQIAASLKANIEAGNRALEQLARLTELLSSQEQFITQKRQLKEKDHELAKEAAHEEKEIDRLNRSHSALLAEHGCESEEHLLQLLETKHEYLKLEKELSAFAERMHEMVAGVAPMDTVLRLLEGNGADDLTKRREAIGQRTVQAKERVEQLHRRQGELTQEMKTLAGDGRLSEAKLELACIENQINACAAHWQTLATTTHLLDRVCEVYETERQPETLREASAFLNQLTEGKYVRIWTPLGKNQLRVDNRSGQALPLEVLSRGTREAVFIALRLSLAAAYSRRGVVLPLVLDDVLVNFDSIRAESAAKVLRDFAGLGHQVIMFTCHEHIMKIFNHIGVEVRVLPNQGAPGIAEIYYPERYATPAALPVVTESGLDQDDVEEIEPFMVETPVEVVASAVPAAPPLEPTPKRDSKVRRVVVVEQPKIDWRWYERSLDALDADTLDFGTVDSSRFDPELVKSEGFDPDLLDWRWVESQDRVDEKAAPEDLWWKPQQNKTIDSISSI
jgi:uncharacterized protein YhaN